ncbi:hypothetical protein JCM11491_005926 [Sporobolomyces phaffii]
MVDPVALYNESQLSIVLPSTVSNTPPLRSRLTPTSTPADADAWIQSLLEGEQRTATYYDELVTLYLVVQLAGSASALSRSQAHAFFLESLPEPHLTVNSSLSYYEAAATRIPPALRTQSALSSSQFPLTPNPYPATSNPTATVDLTARESVLVSTRSFGEGDEREEPKVWVGQNSAGMWVGVWHFTSNLPFIPTPFSEPKLAVTITVSFRDDPKLDRILSTHDEESYVNGRAAGTDQREEEVEAEDYMDDSYDDVNLLSSLGISHSFHLPFSRLPPSFLPPLSNAAGPTPLAANRRHSRTSSLSSDRIPSALAPANPSPLLRRSILKTFDLRKPLQISIRTIDCAIPDDEKSSHQYGGTDGPTQGGMVVVLELVGPRIPDETFQVDGIEVRATSRGGIGAGSGGGSNDIEVKRVAAPGTERGGDDAIRLGPHDQFNLVYKLSLAPSSQLLDTELAIGGGPASGEPMSSVPIGVATSPSQRFTSRFGSMEEEGTEAYEEDEVDRRRERERDRERKKRDEMFRRNLEVVVRGRILVKSRRGAEFGGYAVEVDAPEPEEEEARTLATQVIASRWNYTIDISSFAYKPPPIQARFLPPDTDGSSSRAFARPTSIAAPKIPLLPPSALRPISASATTNGDRTEVESIAGSKRHTMASLASLSLKSPVLGRKAFAPLPAQPLRPTTQRHSSNLASPMPSVATPGATGAAVANVPRRFFSLPPQSQELGATPTLATATNSSFFTNLRQTDTPPPLNPVSPSATRNSLPLPAPSTQGSEPNRRTSWMSGLGIGKTTGPDSGGRGATSWDTAGTPRIGGGPSRESGLGLGFDGPGSLGPLPPLPPQSSLPPRPSEIDDPQYYHYSEPVQNGQILVTVSLVPLRTVKSRRKPEHDDAQDLPPATLPGLSKSLSPSASHHASFNFPPSSPASPVSPRSPSPSTSPDPDSQQPCPSVSEAERTALATSRMPRVGLLDVFLVQLFVVNHTDQVKRFVVGVPPSSPATRERDPSNRNSRGQAALGVRANLPRATELVRHDDDFATLVPLENDVRIGPLAPNSCASLGLRMLAISPGAHVLEELKLVDLADGTETRLKRPLWVVVE